MITITINTDNAAFKHPVNLESPMASPEVERILKNVVNAGFDFDTESRTKLYDLNGNPVGWLEITEAG